MGIHLSEIKPLGALSQAETRDAARALWAEAARRPGGLGAEAINTALEPFRSKDPSITFETIKAAGWLDSEAVSQRRGVAAGKVTLSDLTGTVANAPTLPRMTFSEASTQARTVVQRLDAAPAEIDGISIKSVYLFGSAVRDNNGRPNIGDLDISADFGFDARYSGMDAKTRLQIAKTKWEGLISNGDERLTLSDATALPDMGSSPAAPGKEFHVVRLWQNKTQTEGSFTPAQQASMDALAAKSMATQTRAQAIAQAVTPLPALSPAQTAETLKGWYLLRGYSEKFDPLSTIMDLPKDLAIAVMKRIHPHRGIGAADVNGHRNQSAYYQLRSDADSWIRNNSTAVKTRENPIFFALTNDPETVRAHMNSPGNKVIMTPVNEADLSKFSFTFDDSMGNYRTTVLETRRTGINGEFLPDTSPVHGKVMNAEQLAAAIRSHGTLDAHGAPRTIEAQYWGAEPMKAQTLAYDPKLPKPPPRVAPEKTFTIRQVRPGDQTDLYRLMGGADSPLDAAHPRHPVNEIARLMEASQNSDAQGTAWMAVTPEGRGVGVITTKDFNGGVFVESDFRRMGIAENLVLERESFQFARGETVAHAQIKAGNAASLRLHEKLGYTLDAGSEGDPALRDPETVLRLTKQLDDKTAGQMPAAKPPAAEPEAVAATAGGMTAMAKVNNTVDGAMGALGLVSGTMGAMRAAKEGDEVGVVINTANAVSGGTTLGISIARGMGHEIAPAIGGTIAKANVVLTVATGVYQVAAEKGNFIDKEADGSHNLGNKGERAVAVVATTATAVGLGLAGVGSAGVVPAVVAVAVVGDKMIEARRAWKDVDRQIAENGQPQRRNVSYDGEDGSPDLRKFRHIFPEMLEVSKDMRDSALPFTPKRDPKSGRIEFEDLRKMLLSEDPKLIAEFERALDANIRRQQQVMKDNDSILPKWLRFDDGGTTYTTAQMVLSDLQGAKTELGWYKADTAAWNAAHPSTASHFTGPQAETAATTVTPTPTPTPTAPRPKTPGI